MLKAIAIDDEPLPLEILQNYCNKLDFISLEQTFSKVTEAEKYLQKSPIDLLFLDIQMPKISGIKFYQTLEKPPLVIFTTAHSQYAIDGFELNAVDFLLKPFSFERFMTAANKAKDVHTYFLQKEASNSPYLYVRADYSLIQIQFSDILFVESFADYLNIHLITGEKITARMPMKTLIQKLPEKDFMRVHRSFIVAFTHILKVRRKTIYLAEKEIPIGVNYEEDFFNRYPSK